MNWYNLYKNRLVLAGSWVELMTWSERLQDFISFEHEEKLRMDILKKLNTNYSDQELPELRNQLEVLFLLKEFNHHQVQLIYLSESALVEKVSSIGMFITQLEQGIEDRLQQILNLDLGLRELCFEDLKKEYQKLLIFKSLKRKILIQLKQMDSPLANLAHLFNDF